GEREDRKKHRRKDGGGLGFAAAAGWLFDGLHAAPSETARRAQQCGTKAPSRRSISLFIAPPRYSTRREDREAAGGTACAARREVLIKLTCAAAPPGAPAILERTSLMRTPLVFILLAACALSACTNGGSKNSNVANSNGTANVVNPGETKPPVPTQPVDPNFKACNPYFPLVPGSRRIYTMSSSS